MTKSLSLKNCTTLDLHVRENSETVEREKVLQRWSRGELKGIVPPLIEKWAHSVQIPAPQWGIKRMKTKLGSCNIEARRIWLNLELIKKPPHCLEYVIVHEMIHFLEWHHNDRFVALMDNHLPRWTHIREELNAEPLGHDNWP